MDGFGNDNRVLPVFFALTNRNTIEQTFGKKPDRGDNWHFDIRHIAAQTRFLRNEVQNRTIVVVYIETKQKSWPDWVANTPGSIEKVKKIVDDVANIFTPWQPKIVLNGHSGGGRYIFSYINSVPDIPQNIKRIDFLDSS